MYLFSSKKAAVWLCFFCAGMMVCAGCSPDKYRAEADAEVYNILEENWQDDFGPQVNYRISDVEPSVCDLKVAKVVPESGVLSLSDAVAMATAHNRDYQDQKERLYLVALDLTLAENVFEPQLFAFFDAAYTKDGDEETVSAGGRSGFDLLLADGTAVAGSIAIDWVRFLTGTSDSTLGSVLASTIRKPLMKGSSREIVQENLTQAQRNVVYELRIFARFRKSFVVSIIIDYYRILQSLDAVDNAQSNYDNLSIAVDRAQNLAMAGRVRRFEIDQTEQDLLRAKDNLVRTKENYKQLLDRFKIRLALATDSELELDEGELSVLQDAGLAEPNFPLDEAIELGLEHRLDLAVVADRVVDSERKIVVAADNLNASLDFVGALRVDSKEPDKVGRLQFHDGLYSAGIEVDLPLERTAERNAYRESLIIMTRREREYEEEIDQVKLDIRQAYRDLNEAATRYGIQSKSLELAQIRVDSTSMLLRAGRVVTRDVLDAQEDLLDAQNDRTAALVEHVIAKLKFFRDIGILRVQPDGMWEL